MACDHLAQHIIRGYYKQLENPTNRGFIIETTQDIHETWLDCSGFTWHSVATIIEKNTTNLNQQHCSNRVFSKNDGFYYD